MKHKIELINKDIIELIKSGKLYEKSNVLLLIGENSTGKSIIGEEIAETTDILVIDNFDDRYHTIPNDKNCLIITHYWKNILSKLDDYAQVIVTQYKDLYAIIDVDALNFIGNRGLTLANSLSKFLYNAISGCWTDLTEIYYQEYLNSLDNISESDKLIIENIKSWREKYEK